MSGFDTTGLTYAAHPDSARGRLRHDPGTRLAGLIAPGGPLSILAENRRPMGAREALRGHCATAHRLIEYVRCRPAAAVRSARRLTTTLTPAPPPAKDAPHVP